MQSPASKSDDSSLALAEVSLDRAAQQPGHFVAWVKADKTGTCGQQTYPSGYGARLLSECALHAQVRTLPSATFMHTSQSAVVQWLGYLAFTQETRVQTPAAESVCLCACAYVLSVPVWFSH